MTLPRYLALSATIAAKYIDSIIAYCDGACSCTQAPPEKTSGRPAHVQFQEARRRRVCR